MKRILSILLDEIERTGPLSVARFMEICLYDAADGYYGSGVVRTGREGHYLTSPELDPAFGSLWCRAFEEVWRSCGSPATFRIAEVGGGEGTFARAVLEASSVDFGSALSYVLVEPVPDLRRRQAERLEGYEPAWVGSLDELEPAPGVVFANEVLDNLPVHLVEMSGGGLEEVLVGRDGECLVEARGPTPGELVVRAGPLPEGHRREIGLAGMELARAAARSLEVGVVFFVDYGIEEQDVDARPSGTLLCYSPSGADDDYLDRPGEKDITSHVNWSDIREALEGAGCITAGPAPQRDVLRSLGLEEIVEELRAVATTGSGAAVVRALSRRGAVAALTDAGGLGGLGVVAGAVNIPAPEIPPFASRTSRPPGAGSSTRR